MIDTAEKRRSASSVGWAIVPPGVTANALKDAEWRQQSGWGYSGIAVGSVLPPVEPGGGGLVGGYRHYFRPQEERPRKRRPPTIYGRCSIIIGPPQIAARGTVDNSLPQLVMDEDELFAALLAAID